MTRPVRQVVLPVAGLGTRCLPATKVLPKEMLPVYDRPLIQHAIEEAAAAGIRNVILVTARGKGLLEDHFDRAPELEQSLLARKKQALLETMRTTLPAGVTLASVRQPEALGLGHAVWCARHLIGNEPFAVMLPDDLVLAGRPCLAQMIDAWRETGGNLAAVEEVPLADTARYGILDVAADDGDLVRARGVVEKPAPAMAPSRLAIIGRYILDPAVLRALDTHKRGAGNEIQLTDAIADSMATTPFHGFRFKGRRIDCGTPLGLLEGSLVVAARDPAVRDQLRAALDRP
ncbi:MAG: UTP--glucose-1-phosphate uridylyltransferase [Gammaproteobacteria bacterium]